MSLRNNKATRLNRYMMFGTLFLGILVLGCVFGFLYFALFNKESNPFVQQPQQEGMADSIMLIVNDSTLLEE